MCGYMCVVSLAHVACIVLHISEWVICTYMYEACHMCMNMLPFWTAACNCARTVGVVLCVVIRVLWDSRMEACVVWHISEWVMCTYLYETCYICLKMLRHTHLDESCHTCACVMAHMYVWATSHMNGWVTSHVYQWVTSHIYQWVTLHVFGYLWVISHVCGNQWVKSHVREGWLVSSGVCFFCWFGNLPVLQVFGGQYTPPFITRLTILTYKHDRIPHTYIYICI